MNFLIELKAVDSKRLYELVKQYGVNVTDLGDRVFVYGDVSFPVLTDIIYRCSLFGSLSLELSGGPR